jgi:cytoskeletal protein RodZ
MMVDRPGVDFGTKMKRAREARGVSLREIAVATKISVTALEALERNDISRLPGGIFSRGIVRSYAIEIGLDAEQTVREFLSQFPHDSVTAGSPHVPQEDHAAIESSRRSAETTVKLLAVSVPIAAGILYFTLMARPREAVSDARPERAATGVEASLAIGGEPLRFEILARAPVSVDVDVDGVRRESHTVGTGERVVVQADREVTLELSDAGAVQLTINSQPAVSLGPSGEARTVRIGRQNYGAFLASQ